ncbi:MAG TPA: hypothetical protein VNO23_11370 [Candidatus Binatia bacterium]|nr:hypothetical protein [Candidatus Binatia bacterium]
MLGFAVVIFVTTMLALLTYALRGGEPDEMPVAPSMQPFGPDPATGRPAGLTASRWRSRVRVLAARRRFITMDSLVDGTATGAERAVVAGINVALVSFWLIFLGIGLVMLPKTTGISLVFPVVTGLWLFNALKSQWDDLVAARRRRERRAGRAGRRHPEGRT